MKATQSYRSYAALIMLLATYLGAASAQIERQIPISRTAAGPGNATSHCPALSGDGRFTIFESYASNLAAGDTNSRSDLFLYDGQDGSVKCLSRAQDGTFQHGGENPTTCSSAISRDGSTVVYATDGVGLAGAVQTNISRLYAINPVSGAIELLTPQDLDDGLYFPSVSADCSKVVFVASARRIDPKANGLFQVYLLERPSNKITLLSVDAQGNAAYGHSIRAEISHDGEWVAFDSKATNLNGASIPGVADHLQVFLLNLKTGQHLLVSRGADGEPGNSDSLGAHLSEHGNEVVFFTDADNMIPGQKPNSGDVLLFNRTVPGLELISVTSEGKPVPGAHELLGNAISADGNLIMFRTFTGRFSKFRIEVNVRDRKNARTYLSSFSNSCSFGAEGGSSHSGSLSPDQPKLAFAVGKDSAKSALQVALIDLDVLQNIASAPTDLSAPDADVCGNKATLALSPFGLFPTAALSAPSDFAGTAEFVAATISYETEIRRSGTSQDARRLTTKKNLITVANLNPGTYSVKYRVAVKNQPGGVSRSNFSKATTFKIADAR